MTPTARQNTAGQGRLRRLLVPGLLTVVMLAVLIWLGTWQLHRLAWKSAILAQITESETTAGIPLPVHPADFTKVVATGRFRPGVPALYGSEVRTLRNGPSLGADMVAVLDLADGRAVLVDLGWVPTDRPPPALPVGPVQVQGYVRPAEPAVLFGARDDPAARRFFALDPAVIGPALGAGDAAPYTLVALGDPPPGTLPEPAHALPRPANNHLQYALTWYSFAATLGIIFVLWTRKALRA